MAETPSAVDALAERAGILPEYRDQTGRETRRTSAETARALLRAMRIDAETDARAEESLAAWDARAAREVIAPAVVAREGSDAARVLDIRADRDARWRVEIECEDGERHMIDGDGERAQLPRLPIGYHDLTLTVTARGREDVYGARRIVVPHCCVDPSTLLGDRNVFGLVANLYTLRSATNWGVGDVSDLGAVAEWGASVGAHFIGVNPLHALMNRGDDVSPYSPVSRLQRNPLYIDPRRVPELMTSPQIRERIASPEIAAELEALRESRTVRYAQVMAVKGIVLDALHRAFERDRQSGSPRGVEFDAYVAQNAHTLDSFAVWMAIAEREGSDWRRWPAELRDARSETVARFVAAHASRVDYHRWTQFELDRQLGAAAAAARDAGMRIGLYQDLAIGSSPAGADTWAYPELFAHGASVGAPPDPYAAQGQNWGFPPIDPHALRASGYQYFIDLIRNAFRHSGALRIDHVLGLFRLFWIPEGASGEHGAYVRYPTEDLFGILALESVRANALVVGEDLGTVPEEVPHTLERWGVLSSKVMFFEREGDRGFKPPSSYTRLALATADTHDMVPIAGFWEGRDIAIRERVGLIDAEQAAADRSVRDHERRMLLNRLVDEHLLPVEDPPPPAPALRGAVHALVSRTPSRLVGIALDDLAGEAEPVNVPGVGPDKFPSWSRKMREPVEVLLASEETAQALRCDGRRGTDA